jgi:hypothetical protein
VVLFVLGATEGVFGSFQYSRLSPALAIVLCGAIFATCLLAAWGMGSVTGAFVPAAAWIIASFALSTQPVRNGSVVIANTTAGKWYLYGGTLSVAFAVVLAFAGVLGTRRP